MVCFSGKVSVVIAVCTVVLCEGVTRSATVWLVCLTRQSLGESLMSAYVPAVWWVCLTRQSLGESMMSAYVTAV